ncbi:MAG: hypothetical protein NXH88_04575 [Hyphomonas sp.]|nr:hypothetical protein [Hyphomonas sp.]
MAPSGQIIFENPIEAEFIEKSSRDARGQSNEYVALLQQAELSNFPILETGRYRAVVEYGGEEYFSGAIRFTIVS